MTQFDELAAPQLVRQRRTGNQGGAPAEGTMTPPGRRRSFICSARWATRRWRPSWPKSPTPTGHYRRGVRRRPAARPGNARQHGKAFGHDFSDVRIHDDSAASEAARDVSAKAATVGDHIVFRSGEFNPGTPAGQHILAHELTHVVQQRSGPVDGTSAGGGVKISDPSDRFETAAEANASLITSQLSAEPALQREDFEGEDDVQAMSDASVQRDGEEEEADEEESEV